MHIFLLLANISILKIKSSEGNNRSETNLIFFSFNACIASHS